MLLAADEQDRPTAIFAHNDLIAIGALEAMSELGLRCPQDISVVGYNDAPLTAHLTPPLTTVQLPSRELGRRAGTMLLHRLDGHPEPPGTIALEPQLVIRESVSSPSRSGRRRNA
jgi:LacI family transcriptional regulator